MCLLQCGPNRIENNWTQYMNSYVPEENDGGGGWSQLKFSLGSLYEERQLVRNYWTKSNVGLPLVRYNGAVFKFYRTLDTDYIVHYRNCLPMLDTEMQHTNAQPSAMLLYKHKIIVPSFKSEPHKRKPYIKKRIKPPPQLENKWYFQKDLCDTGLLLLTTTACDLQRFYLNPISQSNNISLKCLNTTLFQNRNFQQTGLNQTYWGPKQQYWLFGLSQLSYDTAKFKDLIPLFQTQRYQEGYTLEKIAQIDKSSLTTYIPYNKQILYFGNIFWSPYYHQESHIIAYSGTTAPQDLFKNYDTNKDKTLKELNFTPLTQPLYITVRYNPNKDTGIGNIIYFKKNTRNEDGWEPPNIPSLQLTGFPLWLALWGYYDWHEKLHEMQQIKLNYILTIRTDFFSEKLPAYVILNDSFIEGHSPYMKEGEPLPADIAHWLPKFKYQELAVDTLCKTGPGTIKTARNSIEAHCMYSFYFKWGGCPNQLENIADPCQQPSYPIPSNFLQRSEIQNPESSPQKELYPFDFRRLMLTKRGAERIKKDSITETTVFTDSRWNAPADHQTSSEEEEENPLLQDETETEEQLQQLKLEQRLLRKRINKLMQETPLIRSKNLKLK